MLTSFVFADVAIDMQKEAVNSKGLLRKAKLIHRDDDELYENEDNVETSSSISRSIVILRSTIPNDGPVTQKLTIRKSATPVEEDTSGPITQVMVVGPPLVFQPETITENEDQLTTTSSEETIVISTLRAYLNSFERTVFETELISSETGLPLSSFKPEVESSQSIDEFTTTVVAENLDRSIESEKTFDELSSTQSSSTSFLSVITLTSISVSTKPSSTISSQSSQSSNSINFVDIITSAGSTSSSSAFVSESWVICYKVLSAIILIQIIIVVLIF